MNSRTPPNRIEVEDHAIEEISQEIINQRALEIAHANGRSVANEKDFENAQKEVAEPAKRSEPTEDDIVAGESLGIGVPPVSSGAQAPRIAPEDENEMGEMLIEEGVEEADRNTRSA